MTGIGLVIRSSTADDHFVLALVHALAEPLIARGVGLFTRVVPDEAAEHAMYRHWAQSEGISGVALLGGSPGDARTDLLRSLGIPFASVVDAQFASDAPAVVIDETASVKAIGDFLASRRHARTVYLAGPPDSVTARSRATAAADHFEVLHVDRSASAAAAAAVAVVAQGPATLLFESDVHAAAAVSTLVERGVRLPEDAAIVSWTDSSLCRSTTPSITALNRRGSEIGTLLGRRMLAAIGGESPATDHAPEPYVVRRDSA